MAVDGAIAEEQVREAFGVALDLPPDSDLGSLAVGKHPAWDSVAHMALVAELEDRFGLSLEVEDIVEMSSFDTTLEVLRRHSVPV